MGAEADVSGLGAGFAAVACFGSSVGAGLGTGLGAGFRVLTGGVSFSAFGSDPRLALIGARAGVFVSSAVDKMGAWGGGGAGRIAAATSLTVGTSGTGFVFGVSLATSFLGLGLGSGCSGGGNPGHGLLALGGQGSGDIVF